MKPVLTVFIDGLKPESIDYMPFLDTFTTKKRIKTELGYSITCHASMYSGVYPNKHLRWFLWEYSPETSPFKWIRRFGIDKLPHNTYSKYACYKVTQIFNRGNTAYFGIPFMGLWYTPMKYWHYLDVSEKKFWSKQNFLEKFPTIFDILRHNNIPFEIVGLVKKGADKSSKIIEQHTFNEIKPWTYLFVGDVDPSSHRYGQDSIQTREKLKEIDEILKRKYRFFEKKVGDFCFMLFSDHGMVKVEGRVNLHTFFRVHGRTLDDYINMIDANYARFWFRNEKERNEVTRILLEMSDKGFILTEEHFKKYNVDMPDNRYGDLIFYLDVPYIFDHGKFGVPTKRRVGSVVDMHGYLPDHPCADGVFISNRKVINGTHVQLVDILPSMLNMLNLPIPTHVDGSVLWKQRDG